jgi:uncharacterized protein Yka (UPF0111/DUF47 family)
MNDQMIKRVQDLGKALAQSKADAAKYEGAMEQILASLKQSNAIDSIDQAQALVEDYAKKIEDKEAEADAIYNDLNTNYSW